MVLQFPSRPLEHAATGRRWTTRVYDGHTELYLAHPRAIDHLTVDVMDHMGLEIQAALVAVDAVQKALVAVPADVSTPVLFRINRPAGTLAGAARMVKAHALRKLRASVRNGGAR